MSKPPEPPRPSWFRGVTGKDALNDGGTLAPGELPPESSSAEGMASAEDPEPDISEEIKAALLAFIRERKFTGYHVIFHRYDPKTEDETWEAITQGMTLKDLVFASASMAGRINELLMSGSQNHEDLPEK